MRRLAARRRVADRGRSARRGRRSARSAARSGRRAAPPRRSARRARARPAAGDGSGGGSASAATGSGSASAAAAADCRQRRRQRRPARARRQPARAPARPRQRPAPARPQPRRLPRPQLPLRRRWRRRRAQFGLGFGSNRLGRGCRCRRGFVVGRRGRADRLASRQRQPRRRPRCRQRPRLRRCPCGQARLRAPGPRRARRPPAHRDDRDGSGAATRSRARRPRPGPRRRSTACLVGLELGVDVLAGAELGSRSAVRVAPGSVRASVGAAAGSISAVSAATARARRPRPSATAPAACGRASAAPARRRKRGDRPRLDGIGPRQRRPQDRRTPSRARLGDLGLGGSRRHGAATCSPLRLATAASSTDVCRRDPAASSAGPAGASGSADASVEPGLGSGQAVGLGGQEARRDGPSVGRGAPVEAFGRVGLGQGLLVACRCAIRGREREVDLGPRLGLEPDGLEPGLVRERCGKDLVTEVRGAGQAATLGRVPAVAARVLAARHAEVERRVERVELVARLLAVVVAAGRGHRLIERRVIAHDLVLHALRQGLDLASRRVLRGAANSNV